MLLCCFDQHGNFDDNQFALLADRLEGMIGACVGKYYLPGGDRDDLYQWGLWGLYKAVLSYDENDRYSFEFVAKRNIHNMIKSAITRANRQKHRPVNEAESLSYRKASLNKDNAELIERLVVDERLHNPLEILADKETAENLCRYIRLYLSRYERLSIGFYLAGYRQQDIAGLLRVERKVVDNSIQRAKRKIADYVRRESAG
ncbi:MAG: sigma-70 family RNA polymerase sigma factor [Sporomusaceae bacterium]|nr:sigma-70 family RNA polymerase sigma factor [Sporomusaceae bacterium]